jgi:hypothetical protein
MLSQKKDHRNAVATVFLNCCNLICIGRFELVSKGAEKICLFVEDRLVKTKR